MKVVVGQRGRGKNAHLETLSDEETGKKEKQSSMGAIKRGRTGDVMVVKNNLTGEACPGT